MTKLQATYTHESVIQALDHLDQSNTPGRHADARALRWLAPPLSAAPSWYPMADPDGERLRWLIDERNWDETEDTPSVCTSEDVHWGDKARALIDRHMKG